MNKFSVSAICMDDARISQDLGILNKLEIKNIHLDIMDGHFVPRYGIMPEMCRRMCDFTDAKMDAHLMVTDPEFAIDQYRDIPNLDTITFHIDGNEHNAVRIIDKIHDVDCRAGIALNMGSGFGSAHRLVRAGLIDFVLFMGIHPGVLKPSARALYLADSIKYFMTGFSKNKEVEIQVDGAVRFDTIPTLLDAGVTNFVGGSSTIFHNAPLERYIDRSCMIACNWKKIKELIYV